MRPEKKDMNGGTWVLDTALANVFGFEQKSKPTYLYKC